jgi:hypothetical protein
MSMSEINFEVVNSYTTDLSGIYNIITVDDKSTWVNDYTKQVICLPSIPKISSALVLLSVGV